LISNITTGAPQIVPNQIRSIQNRYEIVTPNTALPITLALVKQYLRLDLTNTGEDEILTLFVKTALELFEKYTNRILLRTVFKAFKDQFYSPQFDLIRSPFVSLTSYEYRVSGILTPVDPTLFYVTNETDYSRIILKEDKVYPTDIDNQKQSIEIVFTAGIADASDIFPSDISVALLQTVSALYENRGDCATSTINVENLPANVVSIYNKYRIINIVAPNYREGVFSGYLY